MLEYIVPSNIDDRVINRVTKLLEGGALIALPTDTSWSIVCSIRSPAAVKNLRKLSGERDERHFTLLCANISQFSEVCKFDNTRFRLIKSLTPGPYVFILKTLSGTEKILDIKRSELGVRIPDYPVPLRVIENLKQPLYSITAKKSMTGLDEFSRYTDEDFDTDLPPIPENELFESGWELQDIEGLDLILDSGEERDKVFSTILDLTDEEIKVLRYGAGAWPV
ncbi:MAG: L-threonylcarbamoyladenylate synthase [Treponema sp.]|nr:L-threonylcarbamoyladenylate synthase [Treponema sp.]